MDSWLTVQEAAPLVKMSEQALYAAIREGCFPVIRISPRRIRIHPATLAQWSGQYTEKPLENTDIAQIEVKASGQHNK